jgi:putative endonuclease
LLAFYFGQIAEWLAVAFYWAQGYRLVAWRWKTPSGEVDALLVRGRWLVALEVKARRHWDGTLPVTALQLAGIGQSLERFRTKEKRFRRCFCRVDVLTISTNRLPRWVRHAWEETS